MKKKFLSISTALLLAVGTQAQFTDIFNFNGLDGANPEGGSLTHLGNKLYGMTQDGTSSAIFGTIFSMDTDGSNYNVLYHFGGGTAGDGPVNMSLTFSEGKFYGMTYLGGINDSGLIFSIDTNGGEFKDIFDFSGTNGANPTASLTLSGGTLFGTVNAGGLHHCGCIFKIDTNGSGYRDLFDFNGTNGKGPYGGVTIFGNILYGMTSAGGVLDSGCIFKIDTNGSGFKDLFDLNGRSGYGPNGLLTLSVSGNVLYGMNPYGGRDSGNIFAIDTSGNRFKNLFNFNGINGWAPFGSLTLFGNMLYGMTSGCYFIDSTGVIFSIDTDGSGFMDLQYLVGEEEGPFGSLTLSGNVFYGASYQNGTNGDGYIFSFRDPALGIKDLSPAMGSIAIYPNPNNGQFTIQFSTIRSKSLVEIYNVLGEEVYEGALNSTSTKINLSNRPAGLYFCRIINGEGRIIQSSKIIIQ